ncbi:zinc ribbon domain-containing protein [Desulfovibrio sp. OttesenSCG-928-I05]|nr:zinc ribbon domain-containing protein [Desulfovibrio sp. OttesenSCG-928-I05]
MPIYEYRCAKCNKVFEEWHRHIDDDLSHPCPECQGNAERIVSNSTFMLKGGGWYVTDYGNRKSDPVHGSDSSGSKATPSA